MKSHRRELWFELPDNGAIYTMASAEVWHDARPRAHIQAFASGDDILIARSKSLGELVNTTALVFGVGAIVLLGANLRLASRIRRLRDEALRATDRHGRLSGQTIEVRAETDEIGQLRQSFVVVLERLRGYHDYLEQLASRLSHELRTPVAVIRSSLDNLAYSDSPEDLQRYAERARTGIDRLESMLRRMSEAARLEQALQDSDIQPIDLAELLRAAVDGYVDTWPEVQFEVDVQAPRAVVRASGEALMQLLDKLVGNAVGFHREGTPIDLKVFAENGRVGFSVSNLGPPLPDFESERLFDSMVSIRQQSAAAGEEVHLGLGLYIARTIARFHGGDIEAQSLDDGARFKVSFPSA